MPVFIRKQMIDFVKRRAQPGTGSLHSDWRRKQMSHNLLQDWSILAAELSPMIWEMTDGREIDLLDISDRPWAKIALNEAQFHRFIGFPVLPLPYLILMKLEASRMQDVADISRLVKYADEHSRNQIREAVRKYRPQDLEDLEQIIQIEDSL